MYTERLTWSPVWWVVLFSPVLVVLVLVAPPGSPARAPDSLAALGVLAGGLLGLGYAFRALEIRIDEQQLTVGFPIYHEGVPLDQISACQPIRYRWWEFGGYGIRWSRRGKMLNIGGDGGRAVELRRHGRGALLFSSRTPEAVCAALHARRSDLASA